MNNHTIKFNKNTNTEDFVKNLRKDITKRYLNGEFTAKIDETTEVFEKMKYRLVVSNEYSKDYDKFQQHLLGKTKSDFSQNELICILNALRSKIKFINSKNRTLQEVIEEFHFLVEINKIAYTEDREVV